jgi:hypothetical protein
MDSWVIPFAIFIIIDIIIMIWVVHEDNKKNKFNHDLPNIKKETEEENTENKVN